MWPCCTLNLTPRVKRSSAGVVRSLEREHHGDPTIGVYVIDRYTYYALDFLEKINKGSTKTMGQFLQVCPKRVCLSTVTSRKDLFPAKPEQVLLTDFFGSVRNVELTRNTIQLPPIAEQNSTVRSDVSMEPKWTYVEQFSIY
ncbi:Putative GPI-anchor transamidase [Araneus ventricosus]|uniref:GPI-anchor transamidase n=1 Tax=Araneus ventricosus TaxID=182803 RepID=A0A4Y2BM97_ARAVE|nr:Putative GPI-anchor transamidase [Araneus ventricosus]